MATSMVWSSSDKTGTQQQKPFVVISWNVLHMVHEINHVYEKSPVINRYAIQENWANEKRRLNDMVKIISDLLVQHSMMECFICLQEVPADLLPLLDQMLDSHTGSTLVTKPLLHKQLYPRKPHVRGRQGGPVYTDPSEYLVTIHYTISDKGTNIDRLLWTPCPNDSGKGALTVITSSGLTVVNIHVPYDNQAAMSLLNNFSWPEKDDGFVLVGDMNRSSDKLMAMIGEITAGKRSSGLLSSTTTNKATRVGMGENGTLYKSWIDYFVVSTYLKNSAISPAIVHDQIGDISDHYPIVLSFQGM